ncbi:UNVERIFIED_ORG: putative DsbA family dithiol-disulfide isomerase [Zoogloea ramigera]|uniref:DsbA family oxidoreductase n=1 Tax=Duganella zoogloeoides TaxID=75659 RepID=A0ABZ0Y1V2_9BURK|nr:DsbA family oxidoreductase [Duganella zoogloeoides]WQH05315.1 DsbA family oxidoreductase [Duganella zoogloeoides]
MSSSIKIDFVSDVSCPWCAIGLKSLQQAVDNIGDAAQIDLHFQPFELNPKMAPEGQDIGEHLSEKYGSSPEQQEQARAMIRSRGAEVGFDFAMDKRSRIYNTFDAHRLLHWAGLEGKQTDLKLALLGAYFTDGEDPSSHDVLVRVAAGVGLDREGALAVLQSDQFADEVREREQFFQRHGINSVPAVIINEQYLISGGQPAAVFERALREIIAKA